MEIDLNDHFESLDAEKIGYKVYQAETGDLPYWLNLKDGILTGTYPAGTGDSPIEMVVEAYSKGGKLTKTSFFIEPDSKL